MKDKGNYVYMLCFSSNLAATELSGRKITVFVTNYMLCGYCKVYKYLDNCSPALHLAGFPMWLKSVLIMCFDCHKTLLFLIFCLWSVTFKNALSLSIVFQYARK